MGGLPLLILQHDTPLDQRFVQRFVDIYYKAVRFASAGASVSYALWGRAPFAVGAAAIAMLAILLRRRILPSMEQLSAKIQANDAGAVQKFRRTHSAALLVNLAQLVALVWGVTQISL
jgi:hypothetical protein